MRDETRERQLWTEAQAAAIRAQLARLFEGSNFCGSPRQQRLLRHIVEATLAGDADRLKGYTLGVEVFDRGADFDPNVDPIVRVEAGRLRSKLLAHYAGEGADDAVWIDVPKGGYAARFVFGAAAPARSERWREAARGERPASVAPDRAPSNVPASVDRLIGREGDIAVLEQLLAEHRVVTVLGAGGIGKTRLAQAAARRHIDDATARAAWVDLARITDPTLLPATLAQALGLPIVQRGDPLPGLLAALRPLAALVVLDNAEHLVDAVAGLVRKVIDTAADLRVLVTSQAPLRIEGEHVFRLSALEVPSPGAPLAEAERAGAVALFLDRARAADHRFELTPDNLATVIRVCRRLDGLPLAIRLAAARLPLLGLSGLEARLHERLQLLAADSRDAPTRQQTLLAAIEWSHSLLLPAEQTLFRRLGVFVGEFTLPLAVAVGIDAGVDEWVVIDRLQSLVERSLISLEPGDPPRYRMLESQRDYALRQLATRDGELHAALHRHAQAIAAALRDGGEALWSTPDAEWLPHWAPELDNVRAALDWSERHDAALFVSLIGTSAGLFRLLDIGYELRRRAAAIDVEAAVGIDPDSKVRYWYARAVLQAGVSAGHSHEFALEAERLARAIPDRRGLYLALCQRVASSLVPPHQSQALLSEIVELESEEWSARVRAQRRLAECAVHTVAARAPQALQAAEAGFALALEAGSILLTALFGNWIVVALLELGDDDGACQRSREIRHHILPGPAGMVIPFVGTCARCSFHKGDIAAAKQQLEQMFALCRTVEWAHFDFFGDLYMRLALVEGRLDAAARLLGFATVASGRAWHVTRSTRSRDEAGARLASAMEPTRLARLRAEGEKLDNESVCALVLEGACATWPQASARPPQVA